MAGDPHIPLYPGDWLRDGVSGCSLAAQGLWLRMMFLGHDSARYGYLEVNGSPMPPEFIARRCGCDDTAQYETLLSELTAAGVPSTNDNGIIYSRRMVRDASLREVRAKAGRKGGKQTAKQKRSKREAKSQQNHDTDNDIDTDNSSDPKEVDDGRYRGALPGILDGDPFRATLGLWLAYKGKKYKAAGLTAMVSRASNLAAAHGVQAVIAAMDRAMANGWAGWDQESSFGGKNGHQQPARPSHRG